MGGVNHQPCGKSLPCSTRLSRAITLAYARFMQANVTLEDALIGELDNNDPATTFKVWQKSRDDFRDTATLLKDTVDAFTASINDMEVRPFLHDAVLRGMDIQKLQADLVASGAINANDPAFETISEMLMNGGFERIFRTLKARIVQHHAAAQKLVQTFEACEGHARTGTLLRMIETNELPFRLHFAQLMNPLTETLRLFSYSSLISIEIHYRSTHCKPGTSLIEVHAANT